MSSLNGQLVLEAEMVAYNEDLDDIDEFSNLARCIESTSPCYRYVLSVSDLKCVH